MSKIPIIGIADNQPCKLTPHLHNHILIHMARRDIIHKAVKNALLKDGWQIIADPYRIVFKDATLEADIKADKLMIATRENRSIVVEVKSFISPSFIHEFLAACGQYQAYVFLLQEKQQSEIVYMAISNEVYQLEFKKEVIQVLMKRFALRLLVIDINQEAIWQWIE